MFRKLLAAGVLAVGMGSAASAATVIFEDNFDSEGYGLNQGLDNWAVSDGTIDVIGTGFFDIAGPGTYVDMDGTSKNAGRITTFAVFNVVAGEGYTLAFDLGKNGVGAETLSFGFGGWTDSFALVAGPVVGFSSFIYNFTASVSGQTSLFFENSGGDNQGALLDNVSLSAVPLPAGGLMLIGGLAALAALRRRKLS